MSAVLSAIIKGEDNLSDIFDRIANSGARMIDKWQTAGNTASETFTAATSGADVASKAMENAAASANQWTSAVDNAAVGADDASSSFQQASKETENLGDAAQRTSEETERLGEETRRTTEETERLGEETRKTSEEMDEFGKSSRGAGDSGAGMAEQISSALAAAGIVKLISSIKGEVINMSNEFANASTVIIKSTGASGQGLRELENNMLNVFATARNGDLSAVANSIGEVNTRLGLQGQELERATSLFMDYADMNNTNVSSSIRTVSQLMTRWQIDALETESVLDRLTLASQMSGASVDNLTYELLKNQATFDSLGWTLDESIALLARLEQGGISSQSVMYGMRRSVVYFSKEGKDASEALREVIDEIYALGDSADGVALSVETFGVRAGPEMAFAIRSGKLEIEDWIDAIAGADGTLSATANAATTLEERWTQASNKMNVAFMRVLGPAVGGISGEFADLKSGIAEFLIENPILTSVLAGLGLSLVTVAGGVSAITFAKTIAIPKVKLFAATVKTAMGPIGWLSMGLTALVSVGTVVATTMARQNEEFSSLTATSKLQYEEVRRLNRAHEEAIVTYGRNSDAARDLAGAIEGARLVFQENRRTIAEVRAEQDRLIEANQRAVDSHRDTINSINEENRSAQALVSRLDALSSQTYLNAGEQHELSLIVGRLNSQFPTLALSVDDYTNALSHSVDAIDELRRAEADRRIRESKFDRSIEAYIDNKDLRRQMDEVEQEISAAQERINDLGRFTHYRVRRRHDRELQDEIDALAKLQAQYNANLLDIAAYADAMEKYSIRSAEAAAEAARIAEETAYEQRAAAIEAEQNIQRALRAVETGYISAERAASLYNASLYDLEDALRRNEEHSANLAEAAIAVERGLLSAADAIDIYAVKAEDLNDAIASMRLDETIGTITGQMDALIGSYDRAYTAARSTISRQIGLFSDMSNAVAEYTERNRAALDPAAMIRALESQAQYIAEHQANLLRAQELGLDAAITSQLSDGSAKSAATLAAIVSAGEERIAELNEAFAKVEYGKDAFAATVAEMQTNFSYEMDTLTATLEAALDDMDLYDKSKESAVSTIQGYIDGIGFMLPAVDRKMSEFMSRINFTIPRNEVMLGVPGYAGGTTSALPGVAIVGEAGPELVNFRGGEAVYTANETSQILANSRERINTGDMGMADRFSPTAPINHSSKNEKRIVLDITGQCEIEVTGNVDEDTVWEIVEPQLKGAFFNILREEAFEEGDLAYEF